MKIITNVAWVYYVNERECSNLDDHKVGKWMYFFDNAEFAKKICKEAVEQGIVAEAKHSNGAEGVCCFYLNCDDTATHKQILTYFIENHLIRKTKTGKLYNISFKLDDQTRAGEYGADFKGAIKLENFVDLNTGEWIKEAE